ncbi:hypothetical protein ACO0K9_14630 [Undibacterium sp. Ji50W]|uniref:hypothetical protein n=1 Tax=Undibacterium sp. Ji50W TaxID=3413041 RepID=UPI003BF053CE
MRFVFAKGWASSLIKQSDMHFSSKQTGISSFPRPAFLRKIRPPHYRQISENLFTILLRERDRGSCAAQNAHVPKYIPLFALLFTPLTLARYRSQTGSEKIQE